jgi:peptidoglycan lytic transglycosylase D
MKITWFSTLWYTLLFLTVVLFLNKPVAWGAEGQNRVTLRDAARQLGADRIGEYLQADVLDDFALPTGDEWRRFWTSVQGALRSGNLEELAWMLPEAKQALLVLDSIKGGKPYADWLRQRLDYFEVAEFVTRKIPAKPTTVRPGVTPVPRRAVIVVRPSPPPAKIPVAVSRRRTATVSSVDLWKKKLEGRPPPARAAKLVPSLKKIFRDEGIPPELVWQAEVESSFNPEARSPVGARGLYQFMPATGRSFGLDKGPPDERLNPSKSGRAAARYLKRLYRRFDSWPLALAAYNAGEGRVGRNLKKYRVTTFSALAPHLPAETRMYVPKVLATVYHREGVEPEDLPPPTGS